MAIREWTQKHQKATAAIAGGVVFLAVAAIVYQVLANRPAYPTDVPDAYFTIDDGRTYFVDKASKVPPFEANGGQAVRAYVFADSSGTKFVGYLERFSAESRASLAAGQPMTATMIRFGREIKQPGQTTWIKTGDPKVEATIANIKPPDGGDPARIVMIDP